MRLHSLVFVCYLVLATAPSIASAKVFISEVTWMGSVENVNAEWIELYNDGAEQDLTGWTLVAGDDQPNITLTGIIPANGYALLERTNDDTLPGNTALVVYTGALGNAGETLELRDAQGGVQDRVNGGENWELGGDNTTKDTLQRAGTPPTGAWVTAPATPGRGGAVPSEKVESASSIEDSESEDDEGKAQSTSVSKQKKVEEVKAVRLQPALTLDLGEERTVTVGVPTTFSARAYKESNKEIVVQDIDWSFGDGSTAHGKEVTHTYVYTGDYVVYANGSRSGFLSEIRDNTYVVVHVVEPTFAITHADEKYIEIKNTGSVELDLSNFALAVGNSSFRLPAGTIVLPHTAVRFPKSVTKLAVRPHTTAGLFYPNDTLALTYRGGSQEVIALTPTQSAPRVASVSAQAVAPVPLQSDPPIASQANVPVVEPPLLPEVVLPELASVANAYDGLEGYPNSAQGSDSFLWWLVGLVGALLTAVTVVLLVRHEQVEIVKGYEIEEDNLDT